LSQRENRAIVGPMTDSRTTNSRGPSASRARRRTPLPETPERLHRAALRYLGRYASSAGNLRAVLRRRVDRSARLHTTDRAQGEEWIDQVIGRLTSAGLLDDRAYAESRVRSLHRRGYSRYRIVGTLRRIGVAGDAIAEALSALAAESPPLDLAAAIRLAERRRLGPWRDSGQRAGRRERDLAALARAGFPFDLARQVVDAKSPESLAHALDEVVSREHDHSGRSEPVRSSDSRSASGPASEFGDGSADTDLP
jgi:regulatory protein